MFEIIDEQKPNDNLALSKIQLLMNSDTGSPAKLVEEFKTKVSQASLVQQLMDNLLNHNPPGTNHIIANYYSVEVDVPFTVSSVNSKTDIFLGSNKNLYDPGDPLKSI